MKHTDKLKRHSLLLYFLFSYLFSWAFWIPMIGLGESRRPLLMAGTFGPAICALALTGILQGKSGLKHIGKRLLQWRLPVRWYLFSFFSTAVAVLAAIGLYRLAGGPALQFNDPAQWYLIPLVFLYVLLFSVAGEEIGWRGFALPRLQQRHNALAASLILGAGWSLWHLPLFFIPGDFHQDIPIVLFLLQSLALTVLYTWLYNSTNGSLLIAHIFHAASNATLGLLPVLPMDTGGDLRPLWITVGILCALCLFVIIRYGPQTLAGQRPAATETRSD